MRLTDIVSHMNLTVFPIIGLVLFLAVFVGATWRALRRPGAEMRAIAAIPLDDGSEQTRDGAGRPDGGAA